MLAGFAEMGAMARGEVDGGERIYRAMQEGGQVCSPWELRRSGVGNPAAAAALLDAQRRRIQTHYTKDGVACAAGTVGAIKHDSGGAAAKGALRPNRLKGIQKTARGTLYALFVPPRAPPATYKRRPAPLAPSLPAPPRPSHAGAVCTVVCKSGNVCTCTSKSGCTCALNHDGPHVSGTAKGGA
jgi:hypothetical protein